MNYRLLNITTKRLEFINRAKEGINYELKPKVTKKIIVSDNSIYELHMFFRVTSDIVDNAAPFEMNLEIAGLFELVDGETKDIDSFMNNNAVSIIFPYLRSIISNVMSSMMLPPIILPIVDARSIGEEND